MELKKSDSEIAKLINLESSRQVDGLELIPSENYVSSAVLEAMGSILTNKYSEGYPFKRYYGGQEFIDKIEVLAQERAMKLFGTPHANVQPYSGSPANLAVYLATCNPGDKIMGLNLPDGGHLTHGWKVSATAIFYESIPYHVKANGKINFDEIWKLAKKHKPKLIWSGATAYPYLYDFKKFGEISESIGAYHVADIAHVAGLIIGGVHPDPAPYAHIITTTTHKTLRGPRGGMIMVTKKGLKKDPELSEKIDKAIFPGLQGGPHEHQVAATAVALKEASSAKFNKYAKQIVLNAKVLADELVKHGFDLVGGGTENHLMLIDFTSKFGLGAGIFVQESMETGGMTVNKNTVPGEKSSPFYPSGIRLGTPAITSRGMKEKEMVKVAEFINDALKEITNYKLPESKEDKKEYVKDAKIEIRKNKNLIQIRKQVKDFANKFPVPGIK